MAPSSVTQDERLHLDSRSSLGADDPFFPRQGKALTWTGVNMIAVGGGLQSFCVASIGYFTV